MLVYILHDAFSVITKSSTFGRIENEGVSLLSYGLDYQAVCGHRRVVSIKGACTMDGGWRTYFPNYTPSLIPFNILKGRFNGISVRIVNTINQ